MAEIKELERVTTRDPLGDPETITREQPKAKAKKPSMWHVVLLNDDYTPMDFVVAILQKFFHMGEDQAKVVMLEVHTKGKAIAGTYTFEVAETKVYEVMHTAKMAQHPLLAVLEEAQTE